MYRGWNVCSGTYELRRGVSPMRQILSAALILVSVAACTPPAYRQPAASERHAIVKIRSTIHRRYRTNLSHSIHLNEWSIDPRIYGTEQGADATTMHIRVRPESIWWHVRTVFSHQISQRVTRPHTVSERYACGSYTSGTGAYRSTQTRYCYRTRTENRTETRYQTVIDADCQGKTFMNPRAGAVYLVQYDFYGHNDCRLACFEQLPLPDGRFELAPCTH